MGASYHLQTSISFILDTTSNSFVEYGPRIYIYFPVEHQCNDTSTARVRSFDVILITCTLLPVRQKILYPSQMFINAMV